MSDDRCKDQPMIKARHIRQTVMPPYEYQKPQYGFGLISVEDVPDGHGGVKQRIKTYFELGRGEEAVRHATDKVLPASGT
ncbi:MAG: hypothetical protein OXB95_03820 [Rhodobacteraceae bacterium]|nr:hypothetical protein [Paracoccaceae bacterium]